MGESGEYFVPHAFGEAEFIERRSRFIGRVWPVETEREALYILKETRDRHWDATHNVYAYSVREECATRYSDDGEPQGTSALPILNVFKAAGIENFLCIVTRYFGGVLLGTGGLARAYSHTASLALGAAGISVMRLWDATEIICSYSLFERVRNELAASGASIGNIIYGADVSINALIPKDQTESFTTRLRDLSSGSALIEIMGSEYRPVRIN